MGDGEATEAVWITRPRIAVRHVRGLLQLLEQENALDFAEVNILLVPEGQLLKYKGRVFREDQLPAQGILIVGVRE